MTRLDEQHTIAGLAAHAQMSPRTFLRRFAEETGSTQLQWILRARVDTARELLESTRLTRSTASRTRSAWEPDRTSDCISAGPWMCPPRSIA